MAMSSDPGCERLDPDSSTQASSLTDIMAAMTTKDLDDSAANGSKSSRAPQDGAQGKRTHPMRPHLTGRKLSLQERGTYLSGSGGSYTHISPRVARRPTVESKRVSISDSQDCIQLNQYKLKSEIGKIWGSGVSHDAFHTNQWKRSRRKPKKIEHQQRHPLTFSSSICTHMVVLLETEADQLR